VSGSGTAIDHERAELDGLRKRVSRLEKKLADAETVTGALLFPTLLLIIGLAMP
jgi:hypothetical protein